MRDKFNQQMDWDKHLSKKDLRRAEREQLAFLKVIWGRAGWMQEVLTKYKT